MLANAAVRCPAPCPRPQRPFTARLSAVKTTDAATTAQQAAPGGSSGVGRSKGEVYIGHEKEDYEGRRTGVKGRIIIDDPSKYPSRENDVTGGWAGGEAGLKAFIAECQREAELNGGAAAAAAKAKGAASAAARAPQPIAKDGRDVIYLGRGRTIKDDARKYPARNELTGGFAGGELGLAAFKDLGDVPIAEDGRGTKQPSSPLIIAFVLGLAATGGGLLLSTVEEVGSDIVTKGGLPGAADAAGMDEKTRILLTVAISLVGVVGTLAGARTVVESVTSTVRRGASKLAVLGAFWVVVFLAAKAVLEAP